MLPVLALAMLEAPLNEIIALDPLAKQRLQKLEGKSLKISIDAMPIPVVIAARDGRLYLSAESDATVHLSGRLKDFSDIALQGDLAAGVLRVEGDVGTAQRWQQFFAQLDPDWDEKLSLYVGDIAAHHLGKVIRNLISAFSLWVNNVRAASAEYVVEEARWVVSSLEQKHFLSEVDDLRWRVEKLMAKAAAKGIKG